MSRLRDSMLLKLVTLNVVVFLLLRITALVMYLVTGFDYEYTVCTWVGVPVFFDDFPSHCWTIITYMFSQYGVFHLLFNAIWLYWFGKIFIEISSEKQLLALYIYGGIMGALFFMGACSLMPHIALKSGVLIGASAAVLAIVVATAVLMPDYPIPLFLIGTIKLKWIAIATILIDFLSIQGTNGGGHLAHLGGATIGLIYAMLRRHGTDITKPFVALCDWIVYLFNRYAPGRRKRFYYYEPKFRTKKFRARGNAKDKPSASNSAPKSSGSAQQPGDTEELDRILDKIKKSGYAGLTPEERKRLFEVSSRIKQ